LFQRIGTPRIGIEISDVNTRIEPRNQKDGNKKGKKKKNIEKIGKPNRTPPILLQSFPNPSKPICTWLTKNSLNNVPKNQN